MSKTNSKNKGARVFLSIVIIFVTLLSLLLFSLFVYSKRNIDYEGIENLFCENQNSNLIRVYYTDSFISTKNSDLYLEIKASNLNNLWYKYEEFGEKIPPAFIAIEDRKFFEHNGVDLKRTFMATVNYFTKNKARFGGSTITQQVIKNLSGDNESTPVRKLNEIIRAYYLENRHSKEEILEVYLNIIPMGEGIVGVPLAAKHYFGKDVKDLSVAEIATLVGMTNAPTKYNPRKYPEACIEKRNSILYTFLTEGIISNEQYEKSVNEPLTLNSVENDRINNWFVETLLKDVYEEYSKKYNVSYDIAKTTIAKNGYSIYSTMNITVQNILTEYFENEDNFYDKVADGLNYSMVIYDNNNNMLGIYGGVGKKEGNLILNNALELNPPGSSLKPLALYTPLLDKNRINWASVFDDIPLSFTQVGDDFVPFPKNSPNEYRGLTTIKDALRLSKNTVAVNLYNMLGKEEIFNSLIEDYGFDTLVLSQKLDNGRVITDLDVSPLALGQLSYGISLRKLTEAYNVFSGYGELKSGKTFTKVTDSSGNIILSKTEDSKRLYSTGTVQIMNQLLSEVTASGTAKAIELKNYIETAGKTGTSGSDLDRLFVGYTPYLTAGIWCGYTDNSKAIGSVEKSHVVIWDEIMIEVHKELNLLDGKTFDISELEYLPYCMDSGHLFGGNCLLDPRGSRLEWGYFTGTNKPVGSCERHVICNYDNLTKGVATDNCDGENIIQIALLDIPNRSFPKEIIIGDAEYVYRFVPEDVAYGDSFDVPYFINTLEEGTYCGRSKSKKQFNSACYIHSD